jgi:hypothetical protein
MKESAAGLAKLLTVFFLLVTIGASAFGQKKEKKQKEPPQPTVVKLTAAVPSLAALADTPESQTKGGLRITVTAETYQAKDSWTVETRPAQVSRWIPMIAPSPNAQYVERTQTPHLTIAPDRLVFHIHLNNQMSRVFRGSGIAVQFNVAGKIAPVDPSAYGDLANLIIPPRGEQEVSVLGPAISTIPAPCTVGVFFFDVVTNIDQAGNVTEKQNFEWYFSYQTQTTEKEFTVPRPEQTWITP